jgi:hypothetical protein
MIYNLIENSILYNSHDICHNIRLLFNLFKKRRFGMSASSKHHCRPARDPSKSLGGILWKSQRATDDSEYLYFGNLLSCIC